MIQTSDRPTPLRKRGEPRVHVPCSLYEDQVKALRALAQRSDVPQAILLRHAVARFLADHEESGDSNASRLTGPGGAPKEETTR